MNRDRRNRVGRVSAIAALAALSFFVVPCHAALAQVVPVTPGGGHCGDTLGGNGQGAVGGTANDVCGSNLTYVGPAIGSIATVVGPTIIGPSTVGAVNVAAGN